MNRTPPNAGAMVLSFGLEAAAAVSDPNRRLAPTGGPNEAPASRLAAAEWVRLAARAWQLRAPRDSYSTYPLPSSTPPTSLSPHAQCGVAWGVDNKRSN